MLSSTAAVTHRDVGRAFSARRKARGGSGFVVGHRYYTITSEAIDWACEENPADPQQALEASLDGFFADDWAAAARYPYGAWANDPGRWVPAKTVAVDAAERARILRELEMLRRQQDDGLPVGGQIAELEGRLQA